MNFMKVIDCIMVMDEIMSHNSMIKRRCVYLHTSIGIAKQYQLLGSHKPRRVRSMHLLITTMSKESSIISRHQEIAPVKSIEISFCASQ